MRSRTSCCKTIGVITVLLAMAILAVPALAQNTCLQNEYNIAAGLSATSTAQSNALNCTANDVRIAKVQNVRDPATGQTLSSCILGSHFDFIADFEILTTASSTRSNIGMYIATNSTTQALTGACADNVIPPPASHQANGHPAQFPCAASGPAASIMCGTDYYDEFDTSTPTDNCGDTSSNDNGGFGAGSQKVTLLITNYLCQPPAGTNQLVLPNCTSWQIPGGTLLCVAPTAQQSGPNLGAIPGTKSKCNCAVISLPVIAQTPTVVVQKECTTTTNPGPRAFDPGNPRALPPLAPTESPISCSSGVEGSDTVTYHVQVTNTSNFGSIILSTLTDSFYGDITTVQGGVLTTTCAVPQTIAASTTGNPPFPNYECTFTAKNAGTTTADAPAVTDTVTANGTSQFATGNWGPQVSDTVTVTPTEAPSAATVTKSLDSLRAASITARFAVDVKNTSNTTFDENETLTALQDSVFGNISPTPSASIVGTTCFTSASGVSLPVGASGDYMCTYDVTIPLSALSTVEEYGTGKCSSGTCSQGKTGSCSLDSDCDLSCLGLHHSNFVTATINGDEGAADVVSPTRNTLNTDVCLTSFTQSQ